MPDTRPVHVRLEALANRYDAIALGAEKDHARGKPGVSVQDITNARATGVMLHEAADQLETAAILKERAEKTAREWAGES